MQTIIISEPEREETMPQLGIGGHVGNLFFGLLLGLLVLIFDRQHNSTPAHAQGSRGLRPVFQWVGILLFFALIIYMIGP